MTQGKHKVSEEVKKRLREVAISRNYKPPSPKGKKFTIEHRKRMSESRTLFINKKINEKYPNYPPWNLRLKIFTERKRMIKKITPNWGKYGKGVSRPTIQGENNPTKRKDVVEKIKKARLSQVIPHRDTAIELALQSGLRNIGIPFRTHEPITGQPDIFIEPNICVFADGCYWHGCDQCLDRNKYDAWMRAKKIRDLYVTQKLQNEGYKVIRFWGHEINRNVEVCCLEIKNHIQSVLETGKTPLFPATG